MSFTTIFLESADEFISKLDKKTRQKLFQNIRIAEKNTNPKFFKKLNAIFGNLECVFLISKLDCSHFGIRTQKKKRW